jgi:hypothetical protein
MELVSQPISGAADVPGVRFQIAVALEIALILSGVGVSPGNS